MISTDPIDMILLDSEDYAEYKSGSQRYSYQNRWGRRIEVQESIHVWPGTWYIVIEGRDTRSTGILDVQH
jgi:hypothetical protein